MLEENKVGNKTEQKQGVSLRKETKEVGHLLITRYLPKMHKVRELYFTLIRKCD